MQSDTMSFTKQSDTPAGAKRLIHEATALGRAAHPNVVEVVGERTTPDGVRLQLAIVDGSPLAATQLSVREFASLIMSTAVTIAHVHSLGMSHNRLDATHIMVRARDNSAVLCGFGGASLDAAADAQTEDVIALAILLRDYVSGRYDALRARINGDVEGTDVDVTIALLSITDMMIAVGGSAPQLAEALREVLDDSPVVRAPAQPFDRGALGERTRRRPPVWAMAAAILPLALIGGAFFALSGAHNKADASTPAQARVAPCPKLLNGAIAVDTDGDGCPNSVYFGPGSISIDGQHYAVGSPSDQLLVGDWQGTGLATLALLRPTTGEVYVFDAWPGPGQSAQPRLVTTVAGATHIADVRSGHHDVMAVMTPTATTTVDATAPPVTTSTTLTTSTTSAAAATAPTPGAPTPTAAAPTPTEAP